MTDRSININVGQDKILDLDADEQGQFIAFTNSKTVITNGTSLTIDKEIRFPIIRRLDLETFLIADSRTDKLPNGHIYDFNGQLIKSFLIGDGIQDIIIHNKRIVATYFDEGVYGEDGSLIRTLWSGVKYSTGTYKETWDGKDDMAKTVAEKKLEIKVLSNNVQYEWEGASIGNTSIALTVFPSAFCFM